MYTYTTLVDHISCRLQSPPEATTLYLLIGKCDVIMKDLDSDAHASSVPESTHGDDAAMPPPPSYDAAADLPDVGVVGGGESNGGYDDDDGQQPPYPQQLSITQQRENNVVQLFQ